MSDGPAAVDLSFDRVTRLRPGTDGTTFKVDVHPGWSVGDKSNGGYLLALLGRAATAAVPSDGAAVPEVISATATYLAAPAFSTAEIRTCVLRRGRTASHIRAILVQGEVSLVDAVFIVGAVGPAGAAGPPRYNDIAPLDIPPPDGCVRLPPLTPDGVAVGIFDKTDLRLDPATLPFEPRAAETAPEAELRGWLRFADGREPDARSLLYFVDAIPPATLRIGSSGWVPTLTMSVYVRGRPAPGWLAIRCVAHLVAAEMVDETCTLWDSQGNVVAQATQLARLRFRHQES